MNFDTFDSSYIDRLRSGDQVTEKHFVTYFSELITLKLRSRLKSHQDVEDVKQETFARTMALLRSESGIRHAERLGALVNSICNNVLLEQYRSSRRTEPLEDATADLLVDRAPNALSSAISQSTGKAVRTVLEGLNERDRKMLRAVFLEERDKDAICQELGVDRDYLRVLLHRAKASFRELYSRRMERPLLI